jgi:phage-related protein
MAGMGDSAGQAFDSLTGNLEGAILGFQSLEDAAESFAKQMLSLALQKFIFQPLGAAIGIPGFASGTDSAPGGLALVGEKGPELVNLPRGSQVIPNNRLTSMASPRIASVGGAGPGNVTVNVTVPAGVDLATRSEVVKLAEATKRATISAIADQRRRSSRG